MAYDRYDNRRGGDRDRFSDDRYERHHSREHARRDERGFFERAGDEIASWFGDDDAERRRDRDERSERPDNDRYRPYAGDYGRSGRGFGGNRDDGRQDRETRWDRDDYRRTSYAGSRERSHRDPHYDSWRQRQIDQFDRDYDDYRRENQSRFESDFGSWRENRQQKRSMLGQVREHMDVVGNDGEHVGTVDRVAGDRLILTKSDPDSGGAHHSLACTEIDCIKDDRVVLDLSAEKARQRWRDESRERALFEREDQGEAGPHMLDRSFSGTYR